MSIDLWQHRALQGVSIDAGNLCMVEFGVANQKCPAPHWSPMDDSIHAKKE